MSDIELTIDQKGITHLDGCNPGGEFTACGYAYDNDDEYIPCGDGKEIDCPDCLEVIQFFKSIPERYIGDNK